MNDSKFSDKKENVVEITAIARSLEEFLQFDERTIRRLKTIAARRGIDYQLLVRKWIRERLEIEMRKIAV
jgi:hypothetical protein